jgi:O-antigen ligase
MDHSKFAPFFESYQKWTVKLAQASSLLFFYGILASMAAANIGMALTVFFWLISGIWIRRFHLVRASPIFWPILALIVIIIISSTYSIAPDAYANRYYLVYGKFLFIWVLIMIHQDERWLNAILGVMFVGITAVILHTYADVYQQAPWKAGAVGTLVIHSTLYDYIAQGIMSACAVTVAWVTIFFVKSKWIKLVAAIFLILLTFSVFFLLPSRIGQLTLVVSLLATSAVIFKRSTFIVLSLILMAMVVGVVLISPVALPKAQLIITESTAYLQSGVDNTSVGARLSMWSNSLKFIADAPLLGHGLGSYRFLSEAIYTDPALCAVTCIHPHNQLLFFMVEHGILGLILFLIIARSLLFIPLYWRDQNKFIFAIFIGFLSVFLIDSFINSPLWISSLRNFYIGIFSVIFIFHSIHTQKNPIQT